MSWLTFDGSPRIRSDQEDVVQRLRWPGPDERRLLARARRLLEARGRVVVVGMDAFHLGHRVLEAHGLTEVKGAPYTFDEANAVRINTAVLGPDAAVQPDVFVEHA